MITATQRRAVALAGASGYSGQELVKRLASHPNFEIKELIGRETNTSTLKGKVEAAILATPAEVSLEMAPRLVELGIRTVDVSGAFRLKKNSYPEWYGFEHTEPRLLIDAVYGLYPWVKPDQNTMLVANPGCYTTTVLMALVPLLKEKIIRLDSICIDAASGASGAGKKVSAGLMFSELFGNSYAYKTGKHQHWPELVEYLTELGTHDEVKPNFTTKLLPTFRGILASIFFDWHPELSHSKKNVATIFSALNKYYQDEPDILISESEVKLTQICDTNKFAISAHVAYEKPVLFCAADNLVRGAAGQAIMNLNQMFGLPAHQGLI
jgi:N-acetyl-gamma-glutamyl-phosphate reductase